MSFFFSGKIHGFLGNIFDTARAIKMINLTGCAFRDVNDFSWIVRNLYLSTKSRGIRNKKICLQQKKKGKLYNYLESLFEGETFERILLFLRPSPVRWNLATDQLSRSSCIIIGSIVIWPEVYSHCSRTRESALDFRRMMMLWRQEMTLRRLFQSRPREREIEIVHVTH